MNNRVPSENMVKLKELTEKICNTDPEHYVLILENVKDIVQVGKKKIKVLDTPESKIKCYEQMCATITNILKNVKKY